MYHKISKWTFWLLALISVVIMVWGAAKGFTANDGAAVDVLLRWGYILLFAAIALVIILGIVLGAVNDPKSLRKLGLGILLVAVCAGIAYLTASGAPLVGYMGEQPAAQTLKITDTLLNLVYLLGAGAILSILTGEIVSVIRNK